MYFFCFFSISKGWIAFFCSVKRRSWKQDNFFRIFCQKSTWNIVSVFARICFCSCCIFVSNASILAIYAYWFMRRPKFREKLLKRILFVADNLYWCFCVSKHFSLAIFVQYERPYILIEQSQQLIVETCRVYVRKVYWRYIKGYPQK